MFRDQDTMHITQVMGGEHLHVRTCARADVPTFMYLGNGWTDCAEIWFVVRDQLAWHFTKVDCGVHVHIRACATLFHISGTAGGLRRNLVCG